MKKQIIIRSIGTIASILLVSQLFALHPKNKNLPTVTGNSSTVRMNEKVWDNFHKDFKNAEAVSWEVDKNFYLSNFLLNNDTLTAVYDEDGQYISTSRRIEYSAMPLAITMALNDKYGNSLRLGRVTEVINSNYNYTVYYFTINTGKHYLRIKGDIDGRLSVTEKMKIE